MSYKLIDGKAVAEQMQNKMKKMIFSQAFARPPCLAVVVVGQNLASWTYIRHKSKACESVGIHSFTIEISEFDSEEKLLKQIEELNHDDRIDGILVQLPLPSHMNPQKIISQISPKKDVDGFHPLNVGKMLVGQTDGFLPCTPLGILTLIEAYQIETKSKHAVIVGRSNIVGKPTAVLLMQDHPYGNATVTVAHSHTHNLQEICLSGDILIVAAGKPELIKKEMVKKGAIVIDVGMNKIKDETKKSGYRTVGDVDFEKVKDQCSYITPVPGGVGPMTITILLQNTLKSYIANSV